MTNTVNPISYFTNLVTKRFNLVQETTLRDTISTDTKFVTIVTASKLLSPLPKYISRFSIFGFTIYDNLRSIIESNDEGYLSHNGIRLKFQTPEMTIFDIPLSSIFSVEHRNNNPQGIVLKTPDSIYHIGSAQALKIQNSPIQSISADSNNYSYGNMSGWMTEFMHLGLVPEEKLKKHKNINKKGIKNMLILTSLFLLIIFIILFLN